MSVPPVPPPSACGFNTTALESRTPFCTRKLYDSSMTLPTYSALLGHWLSPAHSLDVNTGLPALGGDSDGGRPPMPGKLSFTQDW